MTPGQAISTALEMWQALPYAKSGEGVGRAFALVVREYGVTAPEIAEAARRLLMGEAFPTPAEFRDSVLEIRREADRCDPPCIEVVDEKGHVRLASRSAAAGRQAFERPVPALEGPRRPVSEVFEEVRRRRRFDNPMEGGKPHGR